jgi:hypothetical protein
MSDAFNQGLPADLGALLANPRIVIPGESEVLEMIAEWTLAPSETPSAPPETDTELVADLQARVWESTASSTTPTAV